MALDPAALFSPSQPSPLTSLGRRTSSPLPQHPKIQCYVVPPWLPPTVKELYQSTPDYLGGDPEFVRDDLDAVVGEYPLDNHGRPSHYFVRFRDGLARRISSRVMSTHHTDLVSEYQRRKEQGLLDYFDPAAADVHEHSRMNPRMPANAVPDSSLQSFFSDSLLTEDDDDTSDDDGFTSRTAARRSTRLAAGNKKLTQSKLPFSPQKLRSNRVLVPQERSVSGSDDLGGYGQVDSDVEIRVPTRRSTRFRRNARSNLADVGESDGDTYSDGPQQRSIAQSSIKRRQKKRSAASRPAYGHFRDIGDLDFDHDNEATRSLRAHRDICEKCHRGPAHEELAKLKRGRRKAKADEGESSDNEGQISSLGGWVRCLKCPVVAHWKCLAKSQRDEITRAAHARDKEQWNAQGEEASEPPARESPDRKELDVTQTTEFICGLCMKGGTCMGCLEVVLQPDPSVADKHALGRFSVERIQSDPPDIEMVDNTSLLAEGTPLYPSQELLFRCISCKRLAHYCHLPSPEDAVWADADLANYYQEETEWRCAQCASYVYPLDKILAWRPYPLDAVEPTLTGPPNLRTSLPREYLVKWADRSYRRVQWVPHVWLVSTNLPKLKHFLTKGSKTSLLNEPVYDEAPMDVDRQPIAFEPSTDVTIEVVPSIEPKNISLGPLPDAEQRIPLAWKTIDRVLDVRFWNPSSSASRKHKRRTIHNDESLPSPRQQLERAYEEGEQPDESLLADPDDWFSRTGHDLSVESIDEVVWVFVKWEDLGYEDATWDAPPRHGEPGYEAYKRAFRHFIDSREVHVKKTQKEINQMEARDKNGYDRFALKRDLDEQPDLGQSNQLKLMKFQIDGYNWLCDNWWNRQPSILADDMGLGKTVQMVTFLGMVVEKFSAAPVLVVVPNSTITNWVREFSRWAPRLRVVPLFGEAKSRDVITRYELFHESKREPKYHVLITTYETVTNPRDFTTVFKRVGRWEVLVVDEGQRLKSDNSLLFKKLNELKPIHRIIMTGTPLNNNIRELFSLMNFLDCDKWQDLEALGKEYEELSEDLVRQLHAKLKPYFLRRTKSEVLQLPPKNEVIVPLSLTPLQREIYRSILSQNLDILKHLTQVSTVERGRVGIPRTNLNNMLMQLRKCIQHPYLISDDIEPRNLELHEAHEKLIDASAKLRLLKSLLPKLKARGHRVLLFSQFVIALDIIEDFLRGENYKYLRLDGETKQASRQKGMDEFNKPDSEYFIYLLTTRAGGVGINLYTADTVIIHDPDFNPHQDLQAISRSHRYGQQKICLVFKLMVKGSAEEQIMLAGKKKLVLDHLIVQKMDDGEDGSGDLKSILTFGARALFEEGDQGSKDIIYTDHDLDKLIEKTELERDKESTTNEPGLKFSFAKVWSAEKDVLEDIGDAVLDIDHGDSWAQALERIAAKKDSPKEKELTGRGVRRKATTAFPQQQFDFLEGMEDTPHKGKGKGRKKGRSSKSGSSSDSDVYDASAHYDAGDDTDATTESMDPGHEPPLALTSSEKQPHNPSTSFPTIQTGPSHGDQKCGLCGLNHGSGACEMVGSSSNLVEYREILLNHTNDEPWEQRKAAIEAIEQALYDRGQGHLLVGQPLKLVSRPGSPSTSRRTNGPGKPSKAPKNRHKSTSLQVHAHDATSIPLQPVVSKDSRMSLHIDQGSVVGRHSTLPLDRSSPVVSYKRMSSPGGAPENPLKKQKQEVLSRCPVCSGPPHLQLKNCPVLHQDTHSVTKHILRLSEDPSQARVTKELRRLLKQRKREEARQSGQVTTQKSS